MINFKSIIVFQIVRSLQVFLKLLFLNCMVHAHPIRRTLFNHLKNMSSPCINLLKEPAYSPGFMNVILLHSNYRE
jgi:hypothetical protein